ANPCAVVRKAHVALGRVQRTALGRRGAVEGIQLIPAHEPKLTVEHVAASAHVARSNPAHHRTQARTANQGFRGHIATRLKVTIEPKRGGNDGGEALLDRDSQRQSQWAILYEC